MWVFAWTSAGCDVHAVGSAALLRALCVQAGLLDLRSLSLPSWHCLYTIVSPAALLFYPTYATIASTHPGLWLCVAVAVTVTACTQHSGPLGCVAAHSHIVIAHKEAIRFFFFKCAFFPTLASSDISIRVVARKELNGFLRASCTCCLPWPASCCCFLSWPAACCACVRKAASSLSQVAGSWTPLKQEGTCVHAEGG